jgi:carboxylesterase
VRRGIERLRRDVEERLPRGPDGIVLGAEPIALDGDPDRAALLVHGFGDAPDTLAGLARRLHAGGWTVRVPLLPGHGRTLDAFAASRADDWLAAARDAYDALRARHRRVAIVGLSMGGALSAILAAERPPTSLVLLAPYVVVPRLERVAGLLHPLFALVAPWVVTRNPRSIHDAAARAASRGYGVTAPHLLRELTRVVDRAAAALPRITAPTRVVHSRADNRIPAAAAARAFATLGAPCKDLQWVDGCGHVITVDFAKERVFDLAQSWIERC